MQTQVLNANQIQYASELLRSGEVVGIPTETVYGLAANALDESAVSKIFQAKGRPQDNPLIVHISSVEDIEKLCIDIPECAYQLAEKFWPGPLTMVMKKKDIIPDSVSAGLETVGIRLPAQEIAREIIKLAGVPLAAPSANTSGKPSTTCAQHVVDDLYGKIPAVVDGGACAVGVESTVVDLTTTPPTLLRPGGITLAQLKEVLVEVNISRALTETISDDDKVSAPGMKYRHYAPSAPVVIVSGEDEEIVEFLNLKAKTENIAFLCYGKKSKLKIDGSIKVQVYSESERLEDLARGIFDSLRRLDGEEVEKIYAVVPENGEGLEQAIVNRLEKAAGFNRIVL